MKLFLIDGIGPFFHQDERPLINWSKLPFQNLECDGRFDRGRFAPIRELFRGFCKRVAKLGFNAITLDDLAHLIDRREYPAALRRKISEYRVAYAELFEIALREGLAVYLTSDVMFDLDSAKRRRRPSVASIVRLLERGCHEVFAKFPEVAGIIFRLGEADSGDWQGDFRSDVALRSPKDARRFIKSLLPCFERHGKNMIVRTWSVGMYELGDLIWNRNTFSKVFDGIESKRLIISMKHGESDFFRFLPVNKLFFRSNHQKIIELQARREYEGFGEYPAFIGWEYQAYAAQLASARNVVGCSIWCQTGGWSAFRRLTFIERSSLWSELNTVVALRIFKEKLTVQEAVAEYFHGRFSDAQVELFLELLRLSDEVLRELLYLDDFSSRKIFFRRVRVPPVLWVYWDRIIVNHLMRKILRTFVLDGNLAVTMGRGALRKIRAMQRIADTLELTDTGLDFQYHTFQILSVAREYYLLPFSTERVRRLERLKERYEQRYKARYEVALDFKKLPVSRERLERILSLFLRDKRGYRLIKDRVIGASLSIILSRILGHLEGEWIPRFATERAMGLRAIFK